MFNYDGYLNEEYPSFIWLLFPIALISSAAAAAIYFLPSYTSCIFGGAVVLTVFFEVWLALGGKRWLIAWSLITASPLVIALIVAYNEHIWISYITYIFLTNLFIAADALYYRRFISGALHIVLALLFSVIGLYYNSYHQYTISVYLLAYSLIRIIDYISIRLMLAKR